MSNSNTEPPSIKLAQVLCDELNQIIPSRPDGEDWRKPASEFKDLSSDSLEVVFDNLHKHELTALCISGGGIRSATFGLGVIQALASRKLLDDFDYLSTVSGGGYLGSWLSAWIFRERLRSGLLDHNPGIDSKILGEKLKGVNLAEDSIHSAGLVDFDVDDVAPDVGVQEVQRRLNCVPTPTAGDPNPEPTQLQHLREYSNYMSPRVGLFSADTWTLVGIYLRNLLLNLTIFIPFLMAVLLVPRFLYSIIRWNQIQGTAAVVFIVLALFLGGFSIASILSRLPSKNQEAEVERNTNAWIIILAVIPLVLTAIALSAVYVGILGGREAEANKVSDAGLTLLNSLKSLGELPAFIVGTLLTCAIGYAIFAIRRKGERLRIDPSTFFATLLSAALWGLLLWLLAPRIFDPELLKAALEKGSESFWFIAYVCLSVPFFLLIFLLAGTFFTGLSSGKVTDEDREWLARYGAWILIVGVVWIVLNALVLLGPIGIEKLVNAAWGGMWEKLYPIGVALVGILSGAVSLIGGFSSKSEVVPGQKRPERRSILSVAPTVAAVIFLGFIFVGLAYFTTQIFEAPGFLLNGPAWLYFPADAQTHMKVLAGAEIPFLALWLVGLSAFGLFMAFFVNVNKFSLHGAYRDRLVRAYLGASNKYRKTNTFTGFDDADNFQLHRLKKQRPLHVINAALNLVGGTNLAWQNRKAASFTMSALHSGSWCLGYRHTNEYCRNKKLGDCDSLKRCNRREKDCVTADGKLICQLPGKALRLGTAMAISGAAANPNMGYYSSSVVTFLMSLFNIRLGWWLGNTGPIGSKKDWFGYGPNYFFEKSSPSVAVLPLLNETLGRTDKEKKFLNVTDGGHFENLALYEMVLRRCRYIVLSDGAADPDFKYGEIANAIQKCKVDLGVDISFSKEITIRSRNSKKEDGEMRSRFSLGRITYPEKGSPTGYLLYLRPTFYEDEEPMDVRFYAKSNSKFPHQSTGDQMYDEKQFEAYRRLGYFTMRDFALKGAPSNIEEMFKMNR